VILKIKLMFAPTSLARCSASPIRENNGNTGRNIEATGGMTVMMVLNDGPAVPIL